MTPVPAVPREGGVTTAVVVAGDEETRVLLRGLLRLHHYRVLGEADGSTRALDLVRVHHPALVIADSNLAEGSCSSLLEGTKKEQPGIRLILVAPSGRPEPSTGAGASPDVVLFRPFRIREFADALDPGPAPAAGSPTAP